MQADGVVGPQTITAARNHYDHDALVDRICDLRMAFLRALRTWPTFGKGWSSRVAQVRVTGKAWASGESAPQAAFIPGAMTKAKASDARAAPVIAVADAATGGGIGAGALAGTLQQAQEQLAPFAGSSQFIGNVIAILAVASAVLTISGLVYRWWAARKAARLQEALS